MDNGASSYRRFLDGDDNGLAEIIKQYNEGLTCYIDSFLGNLSVADELSEEVFVKIGVKKPRFAEKSSFKTWLYAIGRNVAKDYLRKASRSSNVSLDSCSEQAAEELPETDMIRREGNETLYRTMQSLSPDYRQVLWLTYFENFNSKEIAKIMHRSVHSVETLAYRARQALKLKLGKEGVDCENV